MTISQRIKEMGPGLVVTAAFIGPGTVTTCSVSGASYSYVLLWALTFSIIVTLVLQEMSARLSIITGYPLGAAIRERKSMKIFAALLVIVGIGVGCAAFETGNITGAVLGLESLLPMPTWAWASIIVAISFFLLYIGKYKIIENVLKLLVAIMGVAFIADMFVAKPDWQMVTKSLVIPNIPPGSLLLVIGLIGTTVVPYNLFLHPSIIKEKNWKGSEGLKNMRFDTIISVLLGGLFSWAIIITSAAVLHPLGVTVTSAGDMAIQLEPLLGKAASSLFAIGLFSAGITSTITAPLAGAYAITQSLGWDVSIKDWRFRMFWMIIMFTGFGFTVIGRSPVEAIIIAQAVNGVLLPMIAILLLIMMNKKKMLGRYKNKLVLNIIGIIAVAVAIFLGARTILHYIFHIL
jgi:NRAMP (natural resistance-associated macrophage protein)-like metal ion transporter